MPEIDFYVSQSFGSDSLSRGAMLFDNSQTHGLRI